MTDTGTFTIEVEYGDTTDQWQFDSAARTPQEAKDYLTSRVVPSDETIHRIGGWWGDGTDRPDGGHQLEFFKERNAQ